MLRQASVLRTLMPGVVGIPHGSWPEIDPERGVSVNGCESIVTGSGVDAAIICGYNSTLVEIEKCADQDILADAERPVVMPVGIEEE